MKKFLFLLLCLTQTLGLQAEDWVQKLVNLNTDIIDSVVCLPKMAEIDNCISTYMIHYHQPLQHEAPELGDLPLRAFLAVHETDDCTQQMTQASIGGYGLDTTLVNYPDLQAEIYQMIQIGELSGRYGGNLLMPEHRYFGESCPEDPWATLGYCEAKEAAADFHALFEAMKKVFSGKWAISGGSKGGITTAIQHAFYPDDADCYVAYAAPFLGNIHDTRMQEYYMEHSLTPELNEKLLGIQREMMSRPSLFDLYQQLYPTAEIDNAYKAQFMYSVASFDFNKRAYMSRQKIEEALEYNEAFIACYYDNRYTDDMLLYFMLEDSLLLNNNYAKWYNKYFSYTAEGATRAVFSVDKKIWMEDTGLAYSYQAAHELGYYDLKWDYYYTDQKEIDEANQLWQSLYDSALGVTTDNVFKDVEFNPTLLAFVRQQTLQAQKPILFIYGGDDVWTGARMEDEYINGNNVQLHILPEQNHGVSILAVTDEELQAKLWAFTDAVFGTETGISQIGKDNASAARTYDLQGRKVNGRGQGLMIRNGRVIFEKPE